MDNGKFIFKFCKNNIICATYLTCGAGKINVYNGHFEKDVLNVKMKSACIFGNLIGLLFLMGRFQHAIKKWILIHA